MRRQPYLHNAMYMQHYVHARSHKLIVLFERSLEVKFRAHYIGSNGDMAWLSFILYLGMVVFRTHIHMCKIVCFFCHFQTPCVLEVKS
jgi:hypothetical protein